MRSSLLIVAAAVLAVLVGTLMWVLGGGQGAVHATAPAALDEARPRERPAAELTASAKHVEPTARTSAESTTAAAEATETRAAAVAQGSPNPVIVRVSISMADGSDYNFAGFVVETQSWDTDTDEVQLHSTEVELENIAEFRFDDDVHLDFVRIVPSRDLGLAFGYVEDHIDLELGDEYTPVLEVAPGADLAGRVLDDYGLPVQGVRVHAYADDNWSDLSDWDPGIVAAETGPDGRYQLPTLPVGSWGLSIEPDGWLQVSPNLDDPLAGTTWFDLEVGDRVEGGDILITSLHRFDVTVVDAAGQPAPQAMVELEPVSFRSPKLAMELEDRPDELQQFLEGVAPASSEDGPLTWPYGHLTWVTDAQGHTKALGVSGSWNLRVRPMLGRGGDQTSEVLVPLELPAVDQVVRLRDTLWNFKGRVVGEGDKPIGRMSLRLARVSDGQSQSTRSDAEDGTFEFKGLPPTEDYQLYTNHQSFISSKWDVPVDPGAERRDYSVRKAAFLRLRIADPAGEPLVRQRFKLISGAPSATLAPAERELFEQAMQRSTQRVSSRRGSATFSSLPAGRYVVGLMLPMVTGELLSNGMERYEMRAFQSWELETSESAHELVCDLSSYSKPSPPPQTQHVGVVRDAVTGAPVPRALVRFQNLITSNWTRANVDGRFSNNLAPGSYELIVMGEGYELLTIPARTYVVGEAQHDFLLQPGGRALSVRFVDSAGQSLPTVHARFLDSEGRPLTALVQIDGSDPRWRDRAVARDGRLEFANVPPGTLAFELTLGGFPIGTPTAEVHGGTAAQEASLPLAMSLDELRAQVREAVAEGEN